MTFHLYIQFPMTLPLETFRKAEEQLTCLATDNTNWSENIETHYNININAKGKDMEAITKIIDQHGGNFETEEF